MKKYIIYSLVLTSFLFSSCRKFVELGVPDTLVVTESAYTNNESAIAVMLGIYAQMQERNNSPYRVSATCGLVSDELQSASSYSLPLYQNALLPANSPTNVIWSDAYSFIYQANSVLENCEKSVLLSPEVKKQLIAEALFIRSFWLFYLVNLWGDVPLPLTTDYRLNATLSRSSVDRVYDQIVADLGKAKSDLNENYVAANSISKSTDKVRPNKAVASALLARVYLYKKDYVSAESEASLLIGNTANYALGSLPETFLTNSKESIWQLFKPTPSGNSVITVEAYYFIISKSPSSSSFNNTSMISATLMNAFDSTDKRKTSWIGKYTNTTVTPNVDYFFPYKYKTATGTSFSERSTVFRLAEQYLIRAEARAYLNNLTGAVADVDAIRERAGIEKISVANPAIGKDALLTVILKERQKELFAEWGHRWMDLKRTSTINTAMEAAATEKKTSWEPYKQLFPLPQNELNRNTQLTQNDKY